MKYQLLPRLTSMLVVWCMLLAWQQAALRIGDAVVPLFLAILALPIAMAGAERAFCVRHAFRDQYLRKRGWLYRLLGMEPLVLALEVVKASAKALLVLAFALSLGLHGWAVLLLDVLFLSLLMPRLPGLLVQAVNDTYLFALSRLWVIKLNAGLLWLDAMSGLLLRGSDHYRGLSLSEALRYSMPDGRVVAQGPVDMLSRLYAGAEGLARWAGSVLRNGVPDPAEWLAALLVLGAVAYLFWLVALACSQALVGSMARPMAIWRPRPQRRTGGDAFEAWWL